MGEVDCNPVTTTLYPLRIYLTTQIPPGRLCSDDTFDDEDPAARFEDAFADRVPVTGAPDRALAFCPCADCPSQPTERFQEQTRTLLMRTYPPRAGKIAYVRCLAGCDFKKLGRAIADEIIRLEGGPSSGVGQRSSERRPKRTY